MIVLEALLDWVERVNRARLMNGSKNEAVGYLQILFFQFSMCRDACDILPIETDPGAFAVLSLMMRRGNAWSPGLRPEMPMMKKCLGP